MKPCNMQQHYARIYMYICYSLSHQLCMFSSEIQASVGRQVLHDVRNALYAETSLSNPQYSQINSSETRAGHMYEVATSAVAKEGYPYETPVPFGTSNAGND